MKRILSVVLTLAMTVSMMPVDVFAAENSSVKELREKFNQYASAQERIAVVNGDYTPIVYTEAACKAMKQDSMEISPQAYENLPEKYEVAYTSVKDQSQYGTCWSFGCVSAAESNYLTKRNATKGLQDEDVVDFSESQIVYMKFNPQGDYKSYTKPRDRMFGFNSGGSTMVFASVTLSGRGLVAEAASPYYIAKSYEDSEILMGAGIMKGRCESAYGKSELRIKNITIADPINPIFYDANTGRYSQYRLNNNFKVWKKALMTTGALAIGYHEDIKYHIGPEDYPYYNLDYWVYDNSYDNENGIRLANHEVAIVGYDDNYSRFHFMVDAVDKNGDLIEYDTALADLVAVYEEPEFDDNGALINDPTDSGAIEEEPEVAGSNTSEVSAIEASEVESEAASDEAEASENNSVEAEEDVNEVTEAATEEVTSDEKESIDNTQVNPESEDFEPRYVIVPKMDGRWIAKNSWGEDIFDKGIMNISYCDPTVADASVVEVEDNDYEGVNTKHDYEYIYQYDYVQCREMSGEGIEGANVFTNNTAKTNTIDAVTVLTSLADTEVAIKVYKNLTDANNPTSGELVSEYAGEVANAGYTRLSLDKAFKLMPDETVSVVVSMESDDVASLWNTETGAETCGSYIELEIGNSYGNVIECEPGQSFVKEEDGEWTDVYDVDGGEGNIGNLAVKLLGNEYVEPPAPKTQSLSVSTSTKTIKRNSVKKKAAYTSGISVKGAKTVLTFTKVSGSSKLSVDKSTGRIKVKKGTKKGTYKIKVKVNAASTSAYKAASKTVTIKVRVK